MRGGGGGGPAPAHGGWAHAALAAAGALHRGRCRHDGDAVMALTSRVVDMPARRDSAARTKIPQIGWGGGSGGVNKDPALIKAVWAPVGRPRSPTSTPFTPA